MTQWTGYPAYHQMAEKLRARILTGELTAGAALPSQADLMREYGVSVTVVRMALSQLRNEGYVTTHQGKGSFVCDPLPTDDASHTIADVPVFDQVMAQLREIHDDLRRVDERLGRLEQIVGPADERSSARPPRRQRDT
jgi:DNA-binding GntR family transcriptional regulator